VRAGGYKRSPSKRMPKMRPRSNEPEKIDPRPQTKLSDHFDLRGGLYSTKEKRGSEKEPSHPRKSPRASTPSGNREYSKTLGRLVRKPTTAGSVGKSSETKLDITMWNLACLRPTRGFSIPAWGGREDENKKCWWVTCYQ